MTLAQARALEELMPRYGLTASALSDPLRAFGRRAPLYLEIGFGNGDNLVDMARTQPDRLFLGSEVHRPGLGHALHCAAEAGLTNLRLCARDTLDILAILPPDSLAGAYMFFPDPWPKKRHHKRRLLQPALLELLASALAPQGCFHFATDDKDYAEAALAALAQAPHWFNLAGSGCWSLRPRQRILTRFERRARVAARPVYELSAALHASPAM